MGTVLKHPAFQNEAVDYSSDLSADITTTGLTHITAIQDKTAKMRRARLAFGRYSFQIWTKYCLKILLRPFLPHPYYLDVQRHPHIYCKNLRDWFAVQQIFSAEVPSYKPT
jgi:hypothetical protein